MVYLYKFLAKVLIAKLYKGMDKLVSPDQPSFFKWRLLVNEVVFMNELVDFTKKIKKKVSFLKWSLKYNMIYLFGVFFALFTYKVQF